MQIDYRRFLNQRESLVLPWLEGHSVDEVDRRLRCPVQPPRPGWYRFNVQGRVATLADSGPVDPPDLSNLPTVRGPLVRFGGQWCVVERGQVEAVWLLGDDGEEPPLFAPMIGRRWAGRALFEQFELETEHEELARRALESNGSLAAVSGASSSLRLAFGYSVLDQTSRRVRVPVSLLEAAQQFQSIIERGAEAAEQFLAALTRERALIAEELRTREAHRAARAHDEAVATVRRQRATQAVGPERIENALDAAGAALLRTRHLGQGHAEVTFRFMNERFITVIDEATLQVLDAGICLGHPPADEELTLESLPGVIREAIDTDALVITRHA